jgi:hypothetical protein
MGATGAVQRGLPKIFRLENELFCQEGGGRSVVDSFRKWYTRRKKATTATKPIRC